MNNNSIICSSDSIICSSDSIKFKKEKILYHSSIDEDKYDITKYEDLYKNVCQYMKKKFDKENHIDCYTYTIYIEEHEVI